MYWASGGIVAAHTIGRRRKVELPFGDLSWIDVGGKNLFP
jgi:hypothetical protein